jgi:hypothetical protein
MAYSGRQELEHYLNELKKGMKGPLNYYRTGKYRFEEEHGIMFALTIESLDTYQPLKPPGWGQSSPQIFLSCLFMELRTTRRLNI